jgi:ATP-binding cassette subfamily F protein uup
MTPYLQVDNLTKSFGDLVLFENISFGIAEGQRIGLIAKNGTGKTTLLNILSGKEGYDSGNIVFRRNLRVDYLEQDPQYPEELTVLEACFHHGNSTVELIKEYERCMETEGHPGLDDLLVRMDHEKAWEYEQKAKQILSQLKIRNFDQQVKHLSGGQLKRVALANALITEPDLLILDEPTNHLDLDMTEWLEEYLRRTNLSLLMVTHDRYFLDRVCSEIIEIDNRQVYQYKGNYSYYLEKRQERIEAKSVEIERANNLYRTELDWMRRMPQARGHKARYREEAFYELEKVAKQRFNNDNVKLEVKASYIGSKIFDADHLYKSFGDLKILEDFSYIFARYEKMGIVGNNGTGKSTFIKILMGQVQPDSGTLDIGETVRFGYYSQDGLQFDEQMKVIDVVQDIAEVIELGNGKKLTASQFLQHFLFTPETQHSYVYKLSGGERRRLYLCTVLMRNPNFLVLDEPTNDLDIITLNVLEEYLQNFKGCVIVVSHDRHLLRSTTDDLYLVHDRKVEPFDGDLEDYQQWLSDVQKQENQTDEAPKENANSAQARKDQKRREAELRAQTQPLRKEIARLEKEMEKLNAQLAQAEEKLGDSELYDQSRKAELTACLQQQASAKSGLEECEMAWLEAQEQLEQMLLEGQSN